MGEPSRERVLLTLQIRVSPDRMAEVEEVVHAILGPTQAMPGCRVCWCYRDIDQEGVLLLVEEWSSTERMQRHLQSEDFRLVLALMDLSGVPPDFKVHKVEQTSALEGVMAELSNKYSGPDAWGIARCCSFRGIAGRRPRGPFFPSQPPWRRHWPGRRRCVCAKR